MAARRPPHPPAKPGGRPRTVDMRECLNAMFSVTRAGGDWRILPHDLPPWNTAYAYSRRWQDDGTWTTIHDTLREQVRVTAGREATPSAAIIGLPKRKDPYRRLAKDYEQLPQGSAAFIRIAMIHLMLRRLSRTNAS